MDEDTAAVRKVLKRDLDAFSTLVNKYQRPIFNFVYRFFGDYELAVELTQDTFLKCFHSLKTFDQARKFSTWLYAIAKNICIDEYKRRRHTQHLYLDDFPPSLERATGWRTHRSPQDQCIIQEEGSRLMEAIRDLDPDKKMPLILHYFQGFSYSELAELLGVPLSTIKIRIFRAKQSLLNKLDV